jgi:hypothetical protein
MLGVTMVPESETHPTGTGTGRWWARLSVTNIAVNQISKIHDWGNGIFSYNGQGQLVGYGLFGNTILDTWSIGTMLPAAGLTGIGLANGFLYGDFSSLRY